MHTTGPGTSTPFINGVALQLAPHTVIDLGDACRAG